jgi:hypothetical protein
MPKKPLIPPQDTAKGKSHDESQPEAEESPRTEPGHVGFKKKDRVTVKSYKLERGKLKKKPPKGNSYKPHEEGFQKQDIAGTTTYVDTEEGLKRVGIYGITGEKSRPEQGERRSLPPNVPPSNKAFVSDESVNIFKAAEDFLESPHAKKYVKEKWNILLHDTRGERGVQVTRTQNPNECLVVVTYEQGDTRGEKVTKFKIEETKIKEMMTHYTEIIKEQIRERLKDQSKPPRPS